MNDAFKYGFEKEANAFVRNVVGKGLGISAKEAGSKIKQGASSMFQRFGDKAYKSINNTSKLVGGIGGSSGVRGATPNVLKNIFNSAGRVVPREMPK